jgi:acetylornithine deacetylase/succinyl-diaminopimelate desuccinylase-like protein
VIGKFSIRLVPDQLPEEVEKKVRDHINNVVRKRGKVNLTDVYNASVNYDIPNTHKNNLHIVLYKMD